jgi:hypothetical protein
MRPTPSSISKDSQPSLETKPRLSKPQAPPEWSICFDFENRPLAYWYDGKATGQITAACWDEYKDGVLLPARTLVLVNSIVRVGGNWKPMIVWEDDDGNQMEQREGIEFLGRLLGQPGLEVIGHNIRNHDLPLLNGWLTHRMHLRQLPALRTSDTLRDLPKTAYVSRSLENMAVYYGLSDKKGMGVAHWERANELDPDGVEATLERVRGDVFIQRALHTELADLGYLRPGRKWKP